MTNLEVAVIAYPRHHARVDYLFTLLAELAANLHASRGRITRTFVAAERTTDELAAGMTAVCQHFGAELYWHEPPAHISANHNFVLSLLREPYCVFAEEDNELHRPVDVSDEIAFLESHPECALVLWQWAPADTILEPGDEPIRLVTPESRWQYHNMIHVRHRERFAQAIGQMDLNIPSVGEQEWRANVRLCKSSYRAAARHPKPGALRGQYSTWRGPAPPPEFSPRVQELLIHAHRS